MFNEERCHLLKAICKYIKFGPYAITSLLSECDDEVLQPISMFLTKIGINI